MTTLIEVLIVLVGLETVEQLKRFHVMTELVHHILARIEQRIVCAAVAQLRFFDHKNGVMTVLTQARCFLYETLQGLQGITN